MRRLDLSRITRRKRSNEGLVKTPTTSRSDSEILDDISECNTSRSNRSDPLNSDRPSIEIHLLNKEKIKVLECLGIGGSGSIIERVLVDGVLLCRKKIQLQKCSPKMIQHFREELNIIYNLPKHPNVVNYIYHSSSNRTIEIFMTLYDCNLRQYIEIYQRSSSHFYFPDLRRIPSRSYDSLKELAVSTYSLSSDSEISQKTISSDSDENTSMAAIPKRTDIFNKSCHRHLTVEEIGHILYKIFQGLCFLHQQNIIHRDLKPDNILLFRNSNFEVLNCVISDFDTAHWNKFSRPRSICGTAGYVAKEVILNQEYDYRIDYYSFGMICYYLMTFQHPFSQYQSSYDISEAVIRGEKPDVPLRISRLPGYRNLVFLYYGCIRDVATRLNTQEITGILQSITGIQD